MEIQYIVTLELQIKSFKDGLFEERGRGEKLNIVQKDKSPMNQRFKG